MLQTDFIFILRCMQLLSSLESVVFACFSALCIRKEQHAHTCTKKDNSKAEDHLQSQSGSLKREETTL